MTPEPTHCFENVTDGVAAYVTPVAGGWRVNMRDTDADLLLPVAFIFLDEARAVAKAQRLVGFGV